MLIKTELYKINILEGLRKVRNRTKTNEDTLVDEAQRILRNDLFTDKKILQNLKQYANSNELITEEDVNPEYIFTLKEIKTMAINYRLKFLESKYYKPEIPYEAVLKIKELNATYKKELKQFKILSVAESFSGKAVENNAALFAKTNHDNYYVIHTWGTDLERGRKIKYWPLRNVETLAITIMVFTLIVTLSLPTNLITLDTKATYWCGYRAGTFFHLLIFFTGFTTYFTITFAKNFSSGNWNKQNDFD
jgi:hypothetical protein